MPRYKLVIEYDGAPFAGWQYQENSPSVQRAIMTAVEAFSGEKVMVHGAGRTDAGVHALGQVAHFDLASERETGRFCHGDAPTLADCCLVPQMFNARRFAVDMAPYPTLQRIEAECNALPAFDDAAPERQADAES